MCLPGDRLVLSGDSFVVIWVRPGRNAYRILTHRMRVQSDFRNTYKIPEPEFCIIRKTNRAVRFFCLDATPDFQNLHPFLSNMQLSREKVHAFCISK